LGFADESWAGPVAVPASRTEYLVEREIPASGKKKQEIYVCDQDFEQKFAGVKVAGAWVHAL